MTGLIDGAIGRARMVLAILLVALLAGTLTYIQLPKEADPDVPIPVVGVTIPLEGVSPEDAERLLIRPVETELQGIEGIDQIHGFALEGAGQIIVEFDVSFDQNQAVLVDYIPCKLTLIAAYLILSSDLCSSSKPIELVTVVKMQVKRMG